MQVVLIVVDVRTPTNRMNALDSVLSFRVVDDGVLEKTGTDTERTPH